MNDGQAKKVFNDMAKDVATYGTGVVLQHGFLNRTITPPKEEIIPTHIPFRRIFTEETHKIHRECEGCKYTIDTSFSDIAKQIIEAEKNCYSCARYYTDKCLKRSGDE